MSETSEGATSGNRGSLLPVARSFPVHVDNLLLVGWAIRSDALLVQAGGMASERIRDSSLASRIVFPSDACETRGGCPTEGSSRLCGRR